MNYIDVRTQHDLDVLLETLKTNETFIREVYYESNSYLTENTIVAPQSLGNLHLVILGEDDEFFGARLIFETVSSFSFPLEYDFNPNGKYVSSGIDFYLTKDMGLIQAKHLKYVIFDEAVLGNESNIFNR